MVVRMHVLLTVVVIALCANFALWYETGRWAGNARCPGTLEAGLPVLMQVRMQVSHVAPGRPDSGEPYQIGRHATQYFERNRSIVL